MNSRQTDIEEIEARMQMQRVMSIVNLADLLEKKVTPEEKSKMLYEWATESSKGMICAMLGISRKEYDRREKVR